MSAAALPEGGCVCLSLGTMEPLLPEQAQVSTGRFVPLCTGVYRARQAVPWLLLLPVELARE